MADVVRLMDSIDPSSFTSEQPASSSNKKLGGARNVDQCASDRDLGARLPILPSEIILQIAGHLLPSPQSHFGNTPSFPCRHEHRPYTASLPSGKNFNALVSLSSASPRFRNTLLPLIWHTIVVTSNGCIPRLQTLFKAYDTLETLSNSRLLHPQAHIRSIVVALPDNVENLSPTYYLPFLRSMDLPRTRQIEHLSWSALEAHPPSVLWSVIGPSLKSLEVDGHTFYLGNKEWAKLQRLEVLKMTGYESSLLPTGVVGFFQAQCLGPAEDAEEEDEVESRPESPLEELQRASSSPPRRRARHLYLDPPPPSISPPSSPPPPTIAPKLTRLKHLSLSTSKTSLLHQHSLISSGAFVGLTCLDIYAVTPEPPFPAALLSAAPTLTHLRLVLDISGAFANFDALWSTLTGRLNELEWLEVDPMPQQNTAPSFWPFVEACEKLQWINGKKVGSFPPCFGGFDPTHPSGALPY